MRALLPVDQHPATLGSDAPKNARSVTIESAPEAELTAAGFLPADVQLEAELHYTKEQLAFAKEQLAQANGVISTFNATLLAINQRPSAAPVATKSELGESTKGTTAELAPFSPSNLSTPPDLGDADQVIEWLHSSVTLNGRSARTPAPTTKKRPPAKHNYSNPGHTCGNRSSGENGRKRSRLHRLKFDKAVRLGVCQTCGEPGYTKSMCKRRQQREKERDERETNDGKDEEDDEPVVVKGSTTAVIGLAKVPPDLGCVTQPVEAGDVASRKTAQSLSAVPDYNPSNGCPTGGAWRYLCSNGHCLVL